MRFGKPKSHGMGIRRLVKLGLKVKNWPIICGRLVTIISWMLLAASHKQQFSSSMEKMAWSN
ncbi:hypothetical protein [Bradyrhizobium sp. CB3481]|uniref:hypothetical protein n=1 Tax=Bradyrhizobium sp. CB3481 TaxID=3039158 RepID=UPI0024B25CEC|nr:hypothetical protein [Bradyrhizobium sp. CB3481]WFU14387.1 hypothetical protein QA643_24690 [Bradyrhizobium sp. CB3481]